VALVGLHASPAVVFERSGSVWQEAGTLEVQGPIRDVPDLATDGRSIVKLVNRGSGGELPASTEVHVYRRY
jgi:hypothetical protein